MKNNNKKIISDITTIPPINTTPTQFLPCFKCKITQLSPKKLLCSPYFTKICQDWIGVVFIRGIDIVYLYFRKLPFKVLFLNYSYATSDITEANQDCTKQIKHNNIYTTWMSTEYIEQDLIDDLWWEGKRF